MRCASQFGGSLQDPVRGHERRGRLRPALSGLRTALNGLEQLGGPPLPPEISERPGRAARRWHRAGATPPTTALRVRAGRPSPQSRATIVLEAWARGRTTMESMLTWTGRSRAQTMHSATSSALSGASTPA